MQFRIADTFTDSLARLTGEEQKAVKTTAFDLQLNPASPGLKFHKLDRAKDKNFWSIRVNADIRLIVHRASDSLLLCYVNHHDRAYDWAANRKLQTHPRTGAAQIVKVVETVHQITKSVHVAAPILGHVSDDDLLNCGVPTESLDQVRRITTEEGLLALAENLPAEAGEALLDLATGRDPVMRKIAALAEPTESSELCYRMAPPVDPLDHPDAQRRFRLIESAEELERALDYPWEKWSVFLHPDQRSLVERDYSGPARVSGCAGTGKTIVALHRAAYLARANPSARVLLTTFSDALANALRAKLNRLVSNEPRLAERIEVYSVSALGLRLYNAMFGQPKLVTPEMVVELLRDASTSIAEHTFSMHFLKTEWEEIVDAWQLDNWEAYRDVPRLGRKTRLREAQRAVLWQIFEQVRAALKSQNLFTHAGMFTALATALAHDGKPPFDFAVVDEAQDISPSQLRFFAALGAGRPNALFFTGDLGQRIFQQSFSWKAVGVDVRGRSRNLHVNYRTSHQIRKQADHLLGPETTDVDGITALRSDTISIFNGPPPVIRTLKELSEEVQTVADWIRERSKSGVLPHEFGIFVRSEVHFDRATETAKSAKIPFTILDDGVETIAGRLSIGTMHLAKGLEFRAVAVMGCDDEIIPLQERIQTVGDDADLQEVYDTERHLLYVACTRARDHLLVTSVEPASEFLDDLRM
jgi:mRNA-degrading endonuclease RelE of RelBE toxin-antitoxin system